ncbi:hypothetical protein FT663_05290 [Candidozyma haemuli var. vulneris]|nr:hypothetical protein FT662_05453 [[Candida] haemuloni var. vulneris]KAF3985451.1 hypothetical protein FT663_05290 [[Candida] haemuloni var. vulneris]
MLPANLLSTPNPYVSRPSYYPPQPQSPSAQQMYHQRAMSSSSSSPIVPYLTHPHAKSGLDHLNLSRTVILKHLSSELSLNELLSEIDHGPIEYCKMFTSTPPSHIKDVSEVKTCYISFVNTKISVAFFHKYTKSSHNLRTLKDKLKGSKYLKLSLNEPCSSMSLNAQPPVGSNNLSKQDFIKLKTLNYILEYNATRCITIKFELASPELFAPTKDKFRAQCSKFGSIEDFKSSVNESNLTLKLLVHFTSIDAAIKVYEYYSKQVQRDHARQLDLSGSEKMSSKCLLVKFHRDRCDRTELQTSRHSSTSHFQKPPTNGSQASLSSSPKISKRPLNSMIQNIPEHDESPAGGFTDVDNPAVVSPLSSPQHSSDNMIPALANDSELGKISPKADVKVNASNGNVPVADSELSASLESVSVVDSHASSPAAPISASHPDDSHFYSYGSEMPGTQMQQAHPMFAPQIAANSLPVNQMHPYQYNPDPFNVGNRTIFLGNLHPYTQVEEIANNVRAGGLVESINFIKARRMCFITFVDPAVALKFYLNHQVLHQLIIHGNDVKVSWGKNHSGPLSRDIALAVTAGASRNVYIGVKGGKSNADKQLQLPGEQTLREDFSKFGDLEQINFYHNKDCGFINFMNISNAIRLVELMDTQNVSKINAIVGDNGEFYEKYKDFKISFGKDRCGNPPKFSFKKKNASFEYFNSSEIDLSRADTGQDASGHNENGQGPHVVEHPEDDSLITEEAAMVFGISTSPARNDKAIVSSESDSEPLEGKAVTSSPEPTSKNGQAKKNSTGCEKDIAKETDSKLKNAVGQCNGEAENNDEDDDEDDDDISIIIGSDITTSTNRNTTPPKQRRHSKSGYHLRDPADAYSQHWYASKNSSSLSLNSNHRKYSNYHQHAFSPMPQPMYMAPQHPPSMQGSSRSNSFYGNSMNGSMPQLVHHNSFSGSSMPQATRSHSSFSGSQVMAQYLAKSQHDNFIYATSILANDVTPEEMREYSSKRTHKKGPKKSSENENKDVDD